MSSSRADREDHLQRSIASLIDSDDEDDATYVPATEHNSIEDDTTDADDYIGPYYHPLDIAPCY